MKTIHALSGMFDWNISDSFLDRPSSMQLLGKDIDALLFLSVLTLLSVGMVMVASASIDYSAQLTNDPFMFAKRHGVYIFLGLMVLGSALSIPIRVWQNNSNTLLLVSILLLIAVLVPGIGRRVNGSQRWISFAGFTLQVSELAKVFLMFYLADYLVRKERDIAKSLWGFVKPMMVLAVVVFLLLLEPDFGASVVIILAAMGMIFIAGVSLYRFFILLSGASILAVLAVIFEPYRLKRMTAFVDPWADDVKFDGGYQLTQSLIAFGRGEWYGVGIGNSIQKLFYLPEAHTDFVFSIWAEETGLVGVSFVIALFFLLGHRSIVITIRALKNKEKFIAYIAIGFTLIIGGQAFINIGVASGLLPTKGLTLPFISYGGSSLIVCCLMAGILLRSEWELKAIHSANEAKKKKKAKQKKSVKKGKVNLYG